MYSRILLAVDDSDDSERAVNAVKEMAGSSDVEVVLFHAFHIPNELVGLSSQFATSDQYLDKVKASLRAEADSLLAKLRDQLVDEVTRIKLVVEEGRPGPAIVQAARDRQCDVLVLGKRGRGRVRQLLLGSTSDYVIHHAACPVVLVP